MDTMLIAFVGFVVAALAMLLITQMKQRVSWPGWLVPAVAVVPLAAWTLFAFIEEGHTAFWPVPTGSVWEMQIWFDRLMSVTAASFLLQNRARAAGMRSEVWGILLIFTGSLGLLPMLARTIQLESRQAG